MNTKHLDELIQHRDIASKLEARPDVYSIAAAQSILDLIAFNESLTADVQNAVKEYEYWHKKYKDLDVLYEALTKELESVRAEKLAVEKQLWGMT